MQVVLILKLAPTWECCKSAVLSVQISRHMNVFPIQASPWMEEAHGCIPHSSLPMPQKEVRLRWPNSGRGVGMERMFPRDRVRTQHLCRILALFLGSMKQSHVCTTESVVQVQVNPRFHSSSSKLALNTALASLSQHNSGLYCNSNGYFTCI